MFTSSEQPLSEWESHLLNFMVLKWYCKLMPRKIRELIKELESAGFKNRGGKGSHRNYLHAKGIVLTISGNLGDDAKPYQEKLVKQKIEEAQA